MDATDGAVLQLQQVVEESCCNGWRRGVATAEERCCNGRGRCCNGWERVGQEVQQDVAIFHGGWTTVNGATPQNGSDHCESKCGFGSE